MRLQLKFKESASADAREDVLARLTSSGARKVDPLFPGSADEHLDSLYVVEAEDDRDDLVRLLEDEEAVEVVEPEARRRLASG